MDHSTTRTDKVKALVKKLGADEDEARRDERLVKVAKAKPVSEKPA